MSRNLILAGTAVAVLFSTAVPAQSVVELIDAGAAPREPLRYRFSGNRTERAAMDMSVQVSLALGEQQIPIGAVPPVRMVMQLKNSEVAADGSARIEFEVVSAEASGDDPQVAQMNQSLAPMRGLAGSYRMDPRGTISEPKFKAPEGGATPQSAELGADLEQSLHQMSSPFPEEAIGAGARWRVVQQVNSAAIQMSQTAEYTLRSRNGNRVELDVRLVDAKMDAPAGLPAGARIDSINLDGGGSTRIELDRLVPSGNTDADVRMVMSMDAGGQTQTMGMNIRMVQAIGPAQ